MGIDVIRAWKDKDYLDSLSQEERQLLPANPAGEVELTDLELASVIGGNNSYGVCNSYGICNSYGVCNSYGICNSYGVCTFLVC